MVAAPRNADKRQRPLTDSLPLFLGLDDVRPTTVRVNFVEFSPNARIVRERN
jgi:hypothetical protein